MRGLEAMGNDFSWGRQSTKKTAGFGQECATVYITMRVKHLYLLDLVESNTV